MTNKPKKRPTRPRSNEPTGPEPLAGWRSTLHAFSTGTVKVAAAILIVFGGLSAVDMTITMALNAAITFAIVMGVSWWLLRRLLAHQRPWLISTGIGATFLGALFATMHPIWSAISHPLLVVMFVAVLTRQALQRRAL